jgi:hypothetical protein
VVPIAGQRPFLDLDAIIAIKYDFTTLFTMYAD